MSNFVVSGLTSQFYGIFLFFYLSFIDFYSILAIFYIYYLYFYSYTSAELAQDYFILLSINNIFALISIIFAQISIGSMIYISPIISLQSFCLLIYVQILYENYSFVILPSEFLSNILWTSYTIFYAIFCYFIFFIIYSVVNIPSEFQSNIVNIQSAFCAYGKYVTNFSIGDRSDMFVYVMLFYLFFSGLVGLLNLWQYYFYLFFSYFFNVYKLLSNQKIFFRFCSFQDFIYDISFFIFFTNRTYSSSFYTFFSFTLAQFRFVRTFSNNALFYCPIIFLALFFTSRSLSFRLFYSQIFQFSYFQAFLRYLVCSWYLQFFTQLFFYSSDFTYYYSFLFDFMASEELFYFLFLSCYSNICLFFSLRSFYFARASSYMSFFIFSYYCFLLFFYYSNFYFYALMASIVCSIYYWVRFGFDYFVLAQGSQAFFFGFDKGLFIFYCVFFANYLVLGLFCYFLGYSSIFLCFIPLMMGSFFFLTCYLLFFFTNPPFFLSFDQSNFPLYMNSDCAKDRSSSLSLFQSLLLQIKDSATQSIAQLAYYDSILSIYSPSFYFYSQMYYDYYSKGYDKTDYIWSQFSFCFFSFVLFFYFSICFGFCFYIYFCFFFNLSCDQSQNLSQQFQSSCLLAPLLSKSSSYQFPFSSFSSYTQPFCSYQISSQLFQSKSSPYQLSYLSILVLDSGFFYFLLFVFGFCSCYDWDDSSSQSIYACFIYLNFLLYILVISNIIAKYIHIYHLTCLIGIKIMKQHELIYFN